VIIPTHNRPELTAEAVASVQAQTFDGWHLHVVDDASDDHTPSVLDAIAASDPRVTVIRRSARGGGNPARQTAFERSSARLVALCDSDDLWEPHKLERQVQLWDQLDHTSTDVGIVTCWHLAVDQDGKPRGPALRPNAGRRWHPFTLFNTSTPLISRAALEAAGGFAPQTAYPLRTTDHVELFLRLTQHHDIATVPEVLVRCRHHDGSRNSDAERTLGAAIEAETLAREVDLLVDERPELRAWLHAWVAGRYIELGESRRARPHLTTALRAAGPTTGVRIAAHYGPWALREIARHRGAA
jgi:glycosyltransferase involved in cell wall biosynthesis